MATGSKRCLDARDGIKGVPYFCDCPERHHLKLVPPSGMDGKRPFSDYFAHYGGSTCMSGGESMKHRLAKHRIRELASTLSFAINKCRQCGFTKNFQSNGHTIQLEVRSYDKRWQYDTVAFDKLGAAVYALEVVNTHYSSQEKIDSTRSSNQQCMGFAEFMADDVLESTDGWLHNIRTLEYPNCPRCKEIAAAAANKQRLAIAAELLKSTNGHLHNVEVATSPDCYNYRLEHEEQEYARKQKKQECEEAEIMRKWVDAHELADRITAAENERQIMEAESKRQRQAIAAERSRQRIELWLNKRHLDHVIVYTNENKWQKGHS